MANQVRPLARLFRGMADLIDHDHSSQTRYEAIAKAAGVVAARATAEELVAGRLWQVDGADLLASAYAFHAGLPRQAATAAHVQAMQQPGPRLGELDPADVAKLWALVSELRGGQVIARGQLIRLTGFIPADLADRLLRLLDGGADLVRGQAARIGNGIDPNDLTTPALAVIVLGWLE